MIDNILNIDYTASELTYHESKIYNKKYSKM